MARKTRVILASACLGVILLSSACNGKDEAADNAEIPAVPVETLVVSAATFVETIEVSGVAEPIHEVTIAAEAPGRVTSAPFEEGKTVQKGDLLVKVDAKSDSARIDVLQNQAASAQREYERTKMLAREGLATPQQLDQAASAVESANLGIRQARVGIGKSSVRSPQTGVVATKFVEEGEYAAPGAPIAHIVDYSTVVIESAVPESDIAFVAAGRSVDVYLPSLDRKVVGEVKRRAIVATAKTRTYPVEVHIKNDDLSILPGMRARVIIPRKTWSNVVVVPRDAILQGYDAKEAMVLPGTDETGPAELRKVELGPARGNDVVVTSGLAPGDRLIVKGHRGIVNGTLVKTVREKGGTEAPSEPTEDSAKLAEGAEPDSAPN